MPPGLLLIVFFSNRVFSLCYRSSFSLSMVPYLVRHIVKMHIFRLLISMFWLQYSYCQWPPRCVWLLPFPEGPAVVRLRGIPGSYWQFREEATSVLCVSSILINPLNKTVFIAQVAVIRLQAIFAQVLLRRMKDTKLDGKRLIELPPKEVSVRLSHSALGIPLADIWRIASQAWVYSGRKGCLPNGVYTLDCSNQCIYWDHSELGGGPYSGHFQSLFEGRYRLEVRILCFTNTLKRSWQSACRNYSQVLVLLLRLRQVCSHPCLIQEDGGAFIAADEFDDESAKPENCEELSRARRLLGPEFVSKVKENFKQAALARMAVEKEVRRIESCFEMKMTDNFICSLSTLLSRIPNVLFALTCLPMLL